MTAYVEPIRRVDGEITAWGKKKKTHWYEDANGQRLTGVTTILDGGIPKPALVGWGIRSVADYAVNRWDELAELPLTERLKVLKNAPYAERDAAANRGTEVHALAELLLHGQTVEIPDELAGHVDAYVRFLDEWEPTVVASEIVVYNLTVGYAGSLDMIVDVGGVRVLADIKTNKTGIYPETALQLAGYRYAEKYLDHNGDPQPMLEVDECRGVWVTSSGYEFLPIEAGPAEFLQFRYAAKTAGWMGNSRGLIGSALTPPVRAEETVA